MTSSPRQTTTDKIADPTAFRAGDGYFGWTDRYGVRPPFFAERQTSGPRPYFTENY